MPSVPPDSNVEFTASDVLSTNVWSGKSPPTVVGIDVACTKIAVDLQNLRRESADSTIQRNLQNLVDLTISDCAFLAFIGEDGKFGQVQVARRGMAHCQPDALSGDALADYPWLSSRMDHLRLSELRDTGAPTAAQATEARRFAALQMGSLLMVVFRIQDQPAGILGLARAMPNGPWDVNLQLLLKLVGTSVATGLDRLRMTQRLAQGRRAAATHAGRGQRRSLGLRPGEQRGLFLTPLESHAGVWDEDMRESPDWRNLVHPDDMTRVQNAIRDHVAGKLPIFESVHRMRHRKWRVALGDQSRAGRVDAHGRLLRLVGVELDITERKLYEEALFREKESAQITLQSIGDGVVTTNADSTIDYINPIAEELTGWRLEDAMGTARGGGVPRLPRGDLRAAGKSTRGGYSPRAPHQVRATGAAHPSRWQ
ncbi:MAG: PAS domain-containing protein [Steroidobacteraceae bacterium]